MDAPEIAAIVKALQSFRTPLATRGSTPDEGIRWLIPKLETFQSDDMDIAPVVPIVQALARELAPLAISWASRTITPMSLKRGVTEIVAKREDTPEVQDKLKEYSKRGFCFSGLLKKRIEVVAPPVHKDASEGITLYHGTLNRYLRSIRKEGLTAQAGVAGADTFGVFLSGTPEGAAEWAIYHADSVESTSRIVVLEVQIPAFALDNLRADMEQAEDFQFEGEPEDWQQSLELIGDVMYDGDIPPTWIKNF